MGNNFHLACWHGEHATLLKMANSFTRTANKLMSTVGVFGVQPIHIIAFRGHYDLLLSVLVFRMDFEDFHNTFGPQSTTASDIEEEQKSGGLSISTVVLSDSYQQLRLMNFFRLDPTEASIYSGYVNVYKKFECATNGKQFMKMLQSKKISKPFPNCPAHFTPLYVAVLANNVEAVQLLLKRGANVHHYISNGDFNLLHVAAYHNRYKIIPLLIDAGAKLFEKNPSGRTPFCVAARWGNLPSVNAICKHPKFDLQKSNGGLALLVATQEGHFHVISTLIKAGCDIHRQYAGNLTPLYGSVVNNHSGVLRTLLRYNADSNIVYFFRDTPLHVAAKHGSSDVIQPLLEAGASLYNPNAAALSPPDVAACNNQLGFLKTAMEQHGYDVNQQDQYGYTILHTVLMMRSRPHCDAVCPRPTISLLRSLVHLGCSMDAPNSEGYLPIHFAAQYDDADAIALFVELGCHVDTPTECPKKRRAIHIAAGLNCVKTITVLSRLGCDLEAPQETPQKYRPLHLTLHHHSKEACQKLLDLGADVDSTTANGWTGVFVAIFDKHMDDMLEILLKNGASVSATFSVDPDQAARCFDLEDQLPDVPLLFAPLKVAIGLGSVEYVKLLFKFGAETTLDCMCLEIAVCKVM